MSAETVYRVAVNIPPAFMNKMMDAIDAVMTPVYPGYRRSFTYYPVTGTWQTLPGAHPFDGKPGEVTAAEETRLEFIVRLAELPAVLRAIEKAHPYEEPAVDVTPELAWRSLLTGPSDRSL